MLIVPALEEAVVNIMGWTVGRGALDYEHQHE
jgi:hypothetical protein